MTIIAGEVVSGDEDQQHLEDEVNRLNDSRYDFGDKGGDVVVRHFNSAMGVKLVDPERAKKFGMTATWSTAAETHDEIELIVASEITYVGGEEIAREYRSDRPVVQLTAVEVYEWVKRAQRLSNHAD